MPDSNDIVYEGYQIDFLYIGRALFELFGGTDVSFESLVSLLSTLWTIWTVFALLFSALLLVGIVYAYIRINQLGELGGAAQKAQERLYKELHKADSENTRWRDIEHHMATDNPNDWKLAIIEADVLLGEILEQAGYAGLSIGDKLKSVSPAQVTTLDDAWQAHKVRNNIAHAGTDFVLTKKLAQDTITQYRRVFEEFKVV